MRLMKKRSEYNRDELVDAIIDVICERKGKSVVYKDWGQKVRVCSATSARAQTVYKNPHWIIGVYDYSVDRRALLEDFKYCGIRAD